MAKHNQLMPLSSDYRLPLPYVYQYISPPRPQSRSPQPLPGENEPMLPKSPSPSGPPSNSPTPLPPNASKSPSPSGPPNNSPTPLLPIASKSPVHPPLHEFPPAAAPTPCPSCAPPVPSHPQAPSALSPVPGVDPNVTSPSHSWPPYRATAPPGQISTTPPTDSPQPRIPKPEPPPLHSPSISFHFTHSPSHETPDRHHPHSSSSRPPTPGRHPPHSLSSLPSTPRHGPSQTFHSPPPSRPRPIPSRQPRNPPLAEPPPRPSTDYSPLPYIGVPFTPEGGSSPDAPRPDSGTAKANRHHYGVVVGVTVAAFFLCAIALLLLAMFLIKKKRLNQRRIKRGPNDVAHVTGRGLHRGAAGGLSASSAYRVAFGEANTINEPHISATAGAATGAIFPAGKTQRDNVVGNGNAEHEEHIHRNKLYGIIGATSDISNGSGSSRDGPDHKANQPYGAKMEAGEFRCDGDRAWVKRQAAGKAGDDNQEHDLRVSGRPLMGVGEGNRQGKSVRTRSLNGCAPQSEGNDEFNNTVKDGN